MHLPADQVGSVTSRRRPKIRDYVRLARFDHMTKHVFVIPGVALAVLLRDVQNDNLLLHVALGIVCVVAIASANYVINEWLDRVFDRHHPVKAARVSVQTELNPAYVYGLWVLFLVVGCAAAAASSVPMLVVAILFGLQGVVYNVPPVRTKDMAYLDVISESINNPFRLLIGWLMIDSTSVPPMSIIIAYWLGGAYLMAAKRWSEYREICASHGRELLIRYRKSFAGYTEIRLLASCIAYALLSASLFSIFIIKYRIEYILLVPPLCFLFAVYLGISMRKGSVAQAPERLFQDRTLMLAMLLVGITAIITTFFDIPILEIYTTQKFVELGY